MCVNPPDGFDDDDSIDINLRTVEQVVRRGVLLITLLRRAALEEPDPDSDTPDLFERESDRFELYSWARIELASEWSDSERAALLTSAGELPEAQLDECLGAAAPAGAVCWALGVIDHLGLDDPETGVETLLTWGPGPWNGLDRLVRKSSLRPEDTIAREREKWELWWWRATIDESDFETGNDLDATVADVAHDAASSGLVEVQDNDFAVNGSPFRLLHTDHQARIETIAAARLLGLNWVCGFGESWANVPYYPD